MGLIKRTNSERESNIKLTFFKKYVYIFKVKLFQHVADPVLSSARWSPMIMFVCAFMFASAWYTGENYHASDAHVISGGVLLTLFCFIVGMLYNYMYY